MALAYTKEFLVDAFLYRYKEVLSMERMDNLRKIAEKDYDENGKDVFRKHTALDAEAIKTYKTWLKK